MVYTFLSIYLIIGITNFSYNYFSYIAIKFMLLDGYLNKFVTNLYTQLSLLCLHHSVDIDSLCLKLVHSSFEYVIRDCTINKYALVECSDCGPLIKCNKYFCRFK